MTITMHGLLYSENENLHLYLSLVRASSTRGELFFDKNYVSMFAMLEDFAIGMICKTFRNDS